MANIFIVDDNPFLSERIGGLVEQRLKEHRRALQVITEAEYVWEIETDDRLGPGDVVLADLYPAGYWVMDRPRPPIVRPPRPVGIFGRQQDRDHPTRIVSAVKDVIKNYMAP